MRDGFLQERKVVSDYVLLAGRWTIQLIFVSDIVLSKTMVVEIPECYTVLRLRHLLAVCKMRWDLVMAVMMLLCQEMEDGAPGVPGQLVMG